MSCERVRHGGGENGRQWGEKAADWAETQEGLFLPFYQEAFRRAGLAAGDAMLDVGCGAGLAARTAAGLGARVSGLDASEGLLGVARMRLPDADLRLGDLEELPFADASFDLVTGFNSFQFAARPAVALAEARRVTRRGGQVAVVAWAEPDGMEAAELVTALSSLQPPGSPGPFALSDPNVLRALVAGAGLAPVEVFEVAAPWTYPDLHTALRALGSASGAPPQAIRDTLESTLHRFRQPDGTYRAGATFRCMLARA